MVQDRPALASSIFITAITDTLGCLVFLGTAAGAMKTVDLYASSRLLLPSSRFWNNFNHHWNQTSLLILPKRLPRRQPVKLTHKHHPGGANESWHGPSLYKLQIA